MTGEALSHIIKACKAGNRDAQKRLYHHFHNYALSITRRYTKSSDEAREVLNDGFLKIFTKIDKYDPNLSFKGWVSRIMVNTSIDHYRKYQSKPTIVDIAHAQHYETRADAVHNLRYEELMGMVSQLPPAYRVVFNLHAVEGFKHPEIAEKLGISVGASKSNLAKARLKLRAMIQSIEGKKSKHAG